MEKTKTFVTAVMAALSGYCGEGIVARPDGFDTAEISRVKVMGRDYWLSLGSGPYADPAVPLSEKDKATGLSGLPLFRDSSLESSFGCAYVTNPAVATWRKMVDNVGGPQSAAWKAFEANAKPDRPVFAACWAKRTPLTGVIDLDYDDFAAWRGRHPNLYALWMLDEWVGDHHNRFYSYRKIKDEKLRKQVHDRLYGFEFTRAGWMKSLRAYFDWQVAKYYDAKDLIGALRSCFAVDHIAAAWGAKIIAVETTNTTEPSDWEMRWELCGFFARGAARQFSIPWLWYHALFYSGYTRDGEFQKETVCMYNPARINRKGRWMPEAGMSRSLFIRGLYYSYFNGPTFITPECWTWNMIMPNADGSRVLSPYGEEFAKFHDFTVANPGRGETYTPVAVLTPFDQGYPDWGGYHWFGEFGYRPGDYMLDGIFASIVPGRPRGAELKRGKENCLHDCPRAMMYDVLVPDSPQDGEAFLKKLSAYPVAILGGEYPDAASFWPVLERYVSGGGTLLAPRAGLPRIARTLLSGLQSRAVLDGASSYDFGKGRIIVPAADWMTPALPRNTERAIRDVLSGKTKFPEIERFLDKVEDELFPVKVSGRCLYGANKTDRGWWIWMLNNGGVTKFIDSFEEIDPSAASCVSVTLKRPAVSVRELTTGRTVTLDGNVARWTIPAGGVAVFEIVEKDAADVAAK